MKVKDLIKRLLELPVNIEEATIEFNGNRLLVIVSKADSNEVYIIE